MNFLEQKYGKNDCSNMKQQGLDLSTALDSSSQVNDDEHDDTVTEKENAIGDENDDKKPCIMDSHPTVDVSPIAGNLTTDRAKLMVDEFDLLFGVEDEPDDVPEGF